MLSLSLAVMLGSCLSWCGSSNTESPAAKEEQRERALAILEEQSRSTVFPSSSPVVGWADTPMSDSCRVEKKAYDVWHQALGPITSDFTMPSAAELRKLEREAEDFTIAVAPLTDPDADRLILAITSYRTAVVSAMTGSAGLDELESMVTAGLAVNGEHRSFQAGCGG
jgi:hypothetical protein